MVAAQDIHNRNFAKMELKEDGPFQEVVAVKGSKYSVNGEEPGWKGQIQGHPTTIFGKISVRKTIWDLEFSEHLL